MTDSNSFLMIWGLHYNCAQIIYKDQMLRITRLYNKYLFYFSCEYPDTETVYISSALTRFVNEEVKDFWLHRHIDTLSSELSCVMKSS